MKQTNLSSDINLLDQERQSKEDEREVIFHEYMKHQPPIRQPAAVLHQKHARYLTGHSVSSKNINLEAQISVHFHNVKEFLFFQS